MKYNFGYGSNDNGNLLSVVNNVTPSLSKSFAYDALNRVQQYKTVNATLFGVQYTIDAWGNLTNKALLSGYGGENLAAAPASAQNRLPGFTYDPSGNGNMLNDGRYTYTFNAENQIAAANGTTFLYDGDGQRVQKSDGTTYWGGGSSGALVESDNSGNAKAEYVFFNGKRIARRDLPGGTVKYYFSDNLGSASVVANAAGAALEQYDYAPYGELHWTNGSDSNHYLFTGKERDSETGNDYFGARYYASNMGRFMSPDPLLSSGRPGNPQTWNRYAYGLNNPLRIIDPTGLWDWDASAGGDMSDDDLSGIARDKHNKRHKWAQNALDFRNDFRDALDAANEAAGSSQLTDDEQSAAQAGVDAYGTEGDGNGVNVGTESGYGGSTILNDNDTFSVKFGTGILKDGNFLAVTVGHEGVHVAQGNAWLDGGESSVADINHYMRESAAWTAGSNFARALGMKSLAPHGGGPEFQVWNKGWKAADVETMRAKGLAKIMDYMSLKPTDTDTYSSEHQHKDQ